ncbi:MAG: hypothetical protein J1F40_09235 [Prevotellaceae bacterium]|nr:hypothetical protein [Prevotellaceae bacterium]
MKKINFLIAIGLMGAASVAQAQTKVASLGFENGDTKYATDGALSEGGVFGDWVNPKDGDVWTEQSEADKKSGEYAFQMVTSDIAGENWDRGFKIGNLPVKENTAYRVSYWIKASATEGTPRVTSWLSKGIENYDKGICSPSGREFGVNGKHLDGSGWKHVSFVSYYANADVLNDIIAGQSWVGNATYPESMGGDGTQTYAEYFEGKLPEKYFVIINMMTANSTYFLDDVLVEEGVTFNEATFYGNTIKLDFGYPTNIADLAKANEGTVSLDPTCVSVTIKGQKAEVLYVEGKEDGYLYVFLGDNDYADDGDEVKVSFTPAADCPIVYNTDARPSSDYESEMKVLGFTGEVAYYDENIDAIPSAYSAPVMLSSVPENGSFEIDPATFKSVAVTFDKIVDISYASATLVNNGVQTDLSDGMTVSEDGITINIAIPTTLADGEYSILLANVASEYGLDSDIIELTFGVGPDNDTTESKEVYSMAKDLADAVQGTFPVGWISNDNGTIHQYGVTEAGDVWNYEWGGNLGGGGSRTYTSFKGDATKAIYWRSLDGAGFARLTYGEQVKDYILPDGSLDPEMPEGIALYLDAVKHQIAIKMFAWKGEPHYDFTLEDLEGNVYASFENILAAPDVNGDANATVTGITKSTADFTVPKAGNYILKFSVDGAGEFMLAGVDLITMPSKAAYYKQLLKEAREKAETVLAQAANEEYNGDTKTALTAAIKSAKEDHFTTPSAIEALIAKLGDLSEKMTARMNNIDNFTISLISAITAYADIEENQSAKYLTTDVAVEAKKMIDAYENTNPSNLSDEQLANVAPRLVTVAAQLANVKDCTDRLTWGIYKAIQTADKIGTEKNDTYDAALNAVTDSRSIAKYLNRFNTIRLYEHIVNGPLADSIMTQVRDELNPDVDSEPLITGVELTGFIHNPKMYQVYGKDPLIGWTLAEGGVMPGFNTGATEENYVENTNINSYGNNNYDLSQTIEGLPAGIYDVELDSRTWGDLATNPELPYGYNAQNDETGEWDKYIYAYGDADDNISVTPFGIENAFSIPTTVVKGVKVKEGTLTFGAHEKYVSGKAVDKEGNSTDEQAWTGTTRVANARLFFVAPLEDFDYKKALDDLLTGIEDVQAEDIAGEAKVAAIYSVSGAKQKTLQKGINIVKYTNGKVEKVLVK